MRGRLGVVGSSSALLAREQLRTSLTMTMLVLLPPVFVVAAAAVLSPFARALGGNVAGQEATALGAGWSVAFMAGAVASSRRPRPATLIAGWPVPASAACARRRPG